MSERQDELETRFNDALDRFAGLFERFASAGHELYLVGGCVRDLVMGHPPKDYDFATDATPAETRRVLRDGGYKAIPIGEAFGTIATVIEGEQYEITTYRVKESYTKGSRHPEVVFGRELAEDLGRRDLTINAMAMSDSGVLVDPFDGRHDLARGVLRVPGGGVEKTREILADDPLRLLRVGRFAARFGFWPDEATTEAARAAAPTILDVSRERWKMELDKLLVAPWVGRGLRWLHRVGVLQFCLPELSHEEDLNHVFDHADLERCVHGRLDPETRAPLEPFDDEPHGERSLAQLATMLELLPAGDAPVRWAGLLHALGLSATRATGSATGATGVGAMLAEEVARRFRFSNDERDLVVYLVTAQSFWAASTLVPDASGAVSRPAVRRLLLAAGPHWERLRAFVEARSAIVARGCRESGSGETLCGRRTVLERLEAIERRARELRSSGAPLAPRLPRGLGQQLMSEAGVPRGPRLGLVMDWLCERILDEELPNEADASVYVEAVLEGLGSG